MVAKQDRETLTTLFDSLPDSVMLLSPSDRDRNDNNISQTYLSEPIKQGNVGFDHYSLDYSNHQVDQLFKSNLKEA